MIPKRYVEVVLPIYILILFASLFINSTEVVAGGYPFKATHPKPYDFKFNNHIDDHQQTQLKANKELFGFLYITPIEGEFIDGIKIVEHCNANTPPGVCEVGWIIRGKYMGEPNQPTFVYQVNQDHPTWLVNGRKDIPQPGSFIHFHYLEPPPMSGFTLGDMRNGYLIELQAVDTFYFRHNGEDLMVTPGIDISTHVNIVGSFPLP